MRTLLVLLLLAALPRPAHACGVTITRAPDEVRAALTDALATEPCTVALEVRVVPTEGGLYVLARDFGGRVRERVVPDARSAAVLVASWAADNRLPAQPAHVSAPALELDDRMPEDLAHPGDERRLELFATLPHGARATVDLIAHARWTFGLGGAVTYRALLEETDYVNSTRVGTREVATTDSRAFGYVARTFGDGVWTIRTALGAGLVHSSISDPTTPLGMMARAIPQRESSVHPTGEAALTIGRDLATDWGLDVALVLVAYGQTLHLNNGVALDRSAQLELAIGVRHRL